MPLSENQSTLTLVDCRTYGSERNTMTHIVDCRAYGSERYTMKCIVVAPRLGYAWGWYVPRIAMNSA